MPIALSEDHKSLAKIAAELLVKADSRGAARALLESPDEPLPATWNEIAALGWLGLHLPEDVGGSGFGLEELVVVVEQFGGNVAPGPFVPTVIASATLNAIAPDELKTRWLGDLATGKAVATIALSSNVSVSEGALSGTADPALSGHLAHVALIRTGDDVAVVEIDESVTREEPRNLDPTRRSARLHFAATPATIVPGAGHLLLDISRVILAAEAAGLASECTRQAAAYAAQRVQFGRPIGSFQAVKHHCANMYVAAEKATAAVWDASRAAATGGDQLTFAAAMAASLASQSAYLCTNLNIQVHGGIGYTWEHDAHLYLRRALVLQALLDPAAAETELTELTRRGISRKKVIELPPDAETMRQEIRDFFQGIKDADEPTQVRRMMETGYLMPAWPDPWGRNAGAVEQLLIEQEFDNAGIRHHSYNITGYLMLSLVQQATKEQVERWVPSALAREVIWCQLFSEPDAGSDAAAIKTRAIRTEGGWLINGQKVWTTGAHLAAKGLATVRTNVDVPKHKGITMMVVDMKAPGVDIRPLRKLTGSHEFNEIFFTDVFVPDSDVVGAIDGGWAVARATLGNESISVGSDESNQAIPAKALIEAYDAHPDRLDGGQARIGRYIADFQSLQLLNLRVASRAVAGGGPGPEGAFTKVILGDLIAEAAAIWAALSGPSIAFLEGPGADAGDLNLTHRVWTVGGGTSEIKRNQIGERILGLPREPQMN